MSTHDVYASLDELRAVVGVATGNEDRLGAALICASRWIDYKQGIGSAVSEVPADPPYTLDVLPVAPQLRNVAVLMATRFYRSPDVSLGVAGGMGDLAIRISSMNAPDVELLLYGLREQWGVA